MVDVPTWSHRIAVVVLAILADGLPPAHAELLDEIRARGVMVWGGDQEGNAPYVYPDPDDPDKLVGFEVELADALAAELGVRAEFRQCDWLTLPEFLRSGKIDIILNGYEWSHARAERMAASRPYYIYQLQLLGRDGGIGAWEDLRATPGRPRRQIAVLGGCAASEYLHAHWETDADIIEYDGNTNAMLQVRNGVHDATLLDLPMAVFYRDKPQGKGLRFVGEPVGRGYYVIYARPDQRRLIAAIDDAIERLFRDGRLKTIYDRHGVWTAAQENLLSADPDAEAAESQTTEGAEYARTGVVRAYGGILLRAAGMTVLLTVVSMPLAMLLGLIVALIRMYGPSALRWACTLYVEVLRGTPVMLQLYVIFFILPQVLPFSFSPVAAAIIGLAVNYSAYEAEIYRAGLQAIPRGQMEAALALGMTRGTALRRVIVPQAVRIVVPPVTNDFIAMFKDTSVCSVIAVTELTKQYNMLANSTGEVLKLAALTAGLYLAMSYPLSVVAARLEKKLAGAGYGVPMGA
ncbi:MAG: amino acid ABC transporter permease [Phycisphaerae bacterium]|nr:MAG: polar amino acid ABC transporter permease [Planctomycetota bacterium]GJQ27649.1 MAG: amino acid ABC transporter permease [Phycisphaerae bacterium]